MITTEQKIQSKFKQTEVGMIPEDWEIVNFSDIADKHKKWSITGGPFGSNLKASDYTTDGIQIIQLQNIGDGRFINESKVFTSIEKANELISCNIYPDDIILSKMGDPVTRACFIPSIGERLLMSSDGIRLVVNEKEFNKRFAHDYINSIYFRKRAIEISTGTTRQRIGLPELKSLKFIKPPLNEQTAIATALSDADAWINSLEKLITKKRLVKQGAMQELLKPKEGWEVKSLGEVVYLQGGYAFKSDVFIDIGIPVIRISDVGNNKVNTQFSVCVEPFKIPNEFITKKGDILIAMSGATTGKIGIYNYVQYAYINQRVGKFVILNEKETSREFISHVVRSEKFKENLNKEIAQGAQPNISGKQIQSIIVPIIKNKQEQTRIATILSDMDAELDKLEDKLAKAKQVKQGMMQELLTGRIRLV